MSCVRAVVLLILVGLTSVSAARSVFEGLAVKTTPHVVAYNAIW
jgi:hypothetical protein